MNHWKETAEILSLLAALKAAGRRAALADAMQHPGLRKPALRTAAHETLAHSPLPGAKIAVVKIPPFPDWQEPGLWEIIHNGLRAATRRLL